LFAAVAGAAAIPFLSRRFRFPSAALELVYGAVLFHAFVHQRPEWFDLLKEIGFVYLMFIAGMELDLRSLARSRRVIWCALVPALSFCLTPLFFGSIGYPVYQGLAVAMVSAGIVIPVLKETKLIRTPIGQDIVGTALMGEVLSIAVLTGVDTYHAHGLSPMAGLKALYLLGLGALGYLALKVLYVLSWWNAEWVEKVMESEDPAEEGIRVVIAVAFAGALLAQQAGAEPILGSFVAGVVFGYVFKNKGRFEEKINAVGFGFFTPFFFMGVGADFSPQLLTSPGVVSQALFLTAMVCASKGFPLLFARAMGIRLLEAAGMVLLLSAPLSMLVVAGTLGERMGLLTPEAKGALILAAIAASILYPYLFRPLARRMAEVSQEG
jgi:Kef-type K+ transport system membrane component KefB